MALYTVKNDKGETNAHVRWRTYPSLIVWISMFTFKKGFASLPARMRIKKNNVYHCLNGYLSQLTWFLESMENVWISGLISLLCIIRNLASYHVYVNLGSYRILLLESKP
jgi:hypothetical protein